MSVRWRGQTRRTSVFPSAELSPLAPTEDALHKEMENGESLDGCQTIRTFLTNGVIIVF